MQGSAAARSYSGVAKNVAASAEWLVRKLATESGSSVMGMGGLLCIERNLFPTTSGLHHYQSDNLDLNVTK
jgi:hypothetical protein